MKKWIFLIVAFFLSSCSTYQVQYASQYGNGMSILNSTGQSFNLISIDVYVDGLLKEGTTSMYADNSSVNIGENYHISNQTLSLIYPNQKVEVDISLYDVQPTKKWFSSSISSTNPKVLVAKAKLDVTGIQNWVDLNAVNPTTIHILQQK